MENWFDFKQYNFWVLDISWFFTFKLSKSKKKSLFAKIEYYIQFIYPLGAKMNLINLKMDLKYIFAIPL